LMLTYCPLTCGYCTPTTTTTVGINEDDVNNNNEAGNSSAFSLSNTTTIYVIVSLLLLVTALVIIVATRNRRRMIDREVERAFARKNARNSSTGDDHVVMKQNNQQGSNGGGPDFDDLVAKFVGLRRHPNSGQAGSPDPRGLGDLDHAAPEFDWDEVSQHAPQSREVGDGKHYDSDFNFIKNTLRGLGGSSAQQHQQQQQHQQPKRNPLWHDFGEADEFANELDDASCVSDVPLSRVPQWFDEMKNDETRVSQHQQQQQHTLQHDRLAEERMIASASQPASVHGAGRSIMSREFPLAGGTLQFPPSREAEMMAALHVLPSNDEHSEYAPAAVEEDTFQDDVPYVYSKKASSSAYNSDGDTDVDVDNDHAHFQRYVDDEYLRTADAPYKYTDVVNNDADRDQEMYPAGNDEYLQSPEGFEFDNDDNAGGAGRKLDSKISLSTVEYDSSSSLNVPLARAILDVHGTSRELTLAGKSSVRGTPDLVAGISALDEAAVTEEGKHSTLYKAISSNVYEMMDDVRVNEEDYDDVDVNEFAGIAAAVPQEALRFSRGDARASIKFAKEPHNSSGAPAFSRRSGSDGSLSSNGSSHVV
jgi:hypothetical protein